MSGINNKIVWLFILLSQQFLLVTSSSKKLYEEFTYNILNDDESDTISYAEFKPWRDMDDGLGRLQFEFKTNLRSRELMFVNDAPTGNGATQRNEFQLSLDQSGGIKAKFIMGHIDEMSQKDITIGSQWNDMRWHRVTVTRNHRVVTVTVDDMEGVLVSQGENDRLVLTSNVFFGGHTDSYSGSVYMHTL